MYRFIYIEGKFNSKKFESEVDELAKQGFKIERVDIIGGKISVYVFYKKA